MRISVLSTAALLSITLAAAPARSGPGSFPAAGWTLAGTLGAGVIGPGADDSARGYSDLWLDIPVVRRAGIGLSFGLYGQTDDGRWKHETYAAATWTTSRGTLSAGVERPAYDLFAPSGLKRLLPLVARDEAQLGLTRSRLTWGAMYEGYLPYGATWASTGTGGLTWAVSAHRIGNRDLTAGSAGISYDRGGWLTAAAVESASDGRSGGKAQIVRDFGSGQAGFSYYSAPAPGFHAMVEGFATLRVAERTEVGVVLQDRRKQSSLAALGLTRDLGHGDSLALGLAREHGRTTLSLGYGWSL